MVYVRATLIYFVDKLKLTEEDMPVNKRERGEHKMGASRTT